MTERLFGTDGVRGLANSAITPEFALELAQAAAIVLGFDTVADEVRPRAVIANDSRTSADFIGSLCHGYSPVYKSGRWWG